MNYDKLVQQLRNQTQGITQYETAFIILCDANNKVIHRKKLTDYHSNQVLLSKKEIHSDIIKYKAAKVIIAHNHPNGNLKASPLDIVLATQLFQMLPIIGVELDAFIIFSNTSYDAIIHNADYSLDMKYKARKLKEAGEKLKERTAHWKNVF